VKKGNDEADFGRGHSVFWLDDSALKDAARGHRRT